MPALTLSGNEVDDAHYRRDSVEGDGLIWPAYAMGIWTSTTNLVRNGGVETNLNDWSAV